MEHQEPPHMLVGMENGAATSENSLVEPQKDKGKSYRIREKFYQVITIQENWKLMSKKNLFMNIFISIIYNNQTVETTQMPSTDAQRNKMWSTHTMESYLVIKEE